MRNWGCIILGVFALAGWNAQAGAPAKKKFELTAAEKELVDLTNKERKEKKLPELKPNPLLFKLAREHSANMAKQQKMEHNLDGKTQGQRAKDAGYRYAATGENIAKGIRGTFPLSAIMKGWMDSEGHRKNILSEKYTEIGIGIARDEKGIPYFTQVFGKPLRP